VTGEIAPQSAETKYPAHDRRSFYKYTSADTAIKILDSSHVRYSSPLLFNDPFDYQSGLHIDFDPQSLAETAAARIESLVLNDNLALPPNHWGQAITYMRQQREQQGFPKDRFQETFLIVLRGLMDELSGLQLAAQRKLWEDFLPRLRVFCISESYDNLLMWSHYSQSHAGVVLEFRVLPDQDNPLCAAGPVRYTRRPPAFMTAREFIGEMLGESPTDDDRMLLQYAYTKSDIWAYEKEWRVWDLESHAKYPLYTDYPLVRDELATVYFGCKISPDQRDTIARLLAAQHPNSSMFQGRKALDDYKLEFDRL
jgi:hypothetical protein